MTNVNSTDCPFRKTVQIGVANICSSSGFTEFESAALESLIEIAQSFIFEAGRSSKCAAEQSQRAHVTALDAIAALREMGFNTRSLNELKKSSGGTVATPLPPLAQGAPKALSVGRPRPHPNIIPSFLPPFPDAHTYIRTSVQMQASDEYATSRESSAAHKRSIDASLVKFAVNLSTEQRVELLPPSADHPEGLFLFAPVDDEKAYLAALLPPTNADEENEDESIDNDY